MDSKNIKYLVLTIILLILSGFGVFLIFKINNQPLSLILPTQKVAVTPTPENTELAEIPTDIPEVSITPVATITSKIASPSPTKKLTNTCSNFYYRQFFQSVNFY
jgi:hypothetical protein